MQLTLMTGCSVGRCNRQVEFTPLCITHTSLEIVQASITLQHNTLHITCLYRPPPNRRNNLTDSMFTEQLPDLLDYINNLSELDCPVGDINIHFDNPLRSLTKHTLTTLNLYNLVPVINKPTHMCGHIIDWVVVRPDDDIHKNLLLQTHINQIINALIPISMFQSVGLLLHTGQLGTWLTSTVHHLLLNFLVHQSLHLLKRRTSTVTIYALYKISMHPLLCGRM